jgi:multiple sugar transport system substrate-binding protein
MFTLFLSQLNQFFTHNRLVQVGLLVLFALAMGWEMVIHTENNTAPNKLSLALSTWGSAEEVAQTTSLIRQFEAQHPTVSVKLIHAPEQYMSKLQLLMATNQSPDVMLMNNLSLPLFAHAKQLKSLKDALPPSESGFFRPQSLETFTVNGQLMALPRDVSVLVMYLNTDWLEHAKLDLPTPSWRWQEEAIPLFQRAVAHPPPNSKNKGSKNSPHWGVSFYAKPALFWLPFVFSWGGKLPTTAQEAQSAFLPSAPETKGLQFYQALRTTLKIAPLSTQVGNTSMTELFLQQKIVGLISGRWVLPALTKQAPFHWKIVPLPAGSKGSIVGVDASGYCVSASTQHPEESIALARFLTSQPAQVLFSKSGLVTPARMDVPLEANQSAFLQAIATGKATHPPVQWEAWQELMLETLTPAFEGQQTVEAVLQSASFRKRQTQEVFSQ